MYNELHIQKLIQYPFYQHSPAVHVVEIYKDTPLKFPYLGTTNCPPLIKRVWLFSLFEQTSIPISQKHISLCEENF